MTKYLGIDYGEKRVGIAISDPFKIISKPFKIIENIDTDYVIEQIQEIIKKEKIEKIIVGMPYNMNGTIGFQGEIVISFTNELKKLGYVVIFEDERETSKKTKEILKEIKQKEKYIDDRAASIILQNYLDYN